MPDLAHLNNRAHHSISRGITRYGFSFDKYQLAAFRRRITDAMDPSIISGGCIKLHQQTSHLSHWALWHGGEWIAMVFDDRMQAIVTMLPKRVLRYYKNLLPW